MTRIEIYDTTLRDGMQGRGMLLSVEDQIRVIEHLDALGVDLIEAGFPSSNPKERELFAHLEGKRLKNAEIVAFGMTRRRGTAASKDASLRALASCFAPICALVGKTWLLHVDKVVKVDPATNLKIIAESVRFLSQQGKRVIYDAEHFFDGWRADPDYALACLTAAAEAGAEAVVPCDTNGASLPHEISEAMTDVVALFEGTGVRVGVHCHNDAECGVANSLAAVRVGARQVQGTINGYGERCGNANLVSIIPNLQLKMSYRCVTKAQLKSLTETAHFVDELLNRMPDGDQPYVGKNAFAHKGGLHVAGVMEDSTTFEHVDPMLVGNEREFLVSELSGRATIRAHAETANIPLTNDQVKRVSRSLKDLESQGYQFEAADASFELLMRKVAGMHVRKFELEHWAVRVEKRGDEPAVTQAAVRIRVPGDEGGRSLSSFAEGTGPVHALDLALRDAIRHEHQGVDDLVLANYKVRIVDEAKGAAAVTCVLIDFSRADAEAHRIWGSIGVSPNVIEASWDALVDSLEYGMQTSTQIEHSASA